MKKVTLIFIVAFTFKARRQQRFMKMPERRYRLLLMRKKKRKLFLSGGLQKELILLPHALEDLF